jgi:hypothetical protein
MVMCLFHQSSRIKWLLVQSGVFCVLELLASA